MDVLNFTSMKAYACFVSGTQTHKAWQSVEIFLHGTMLELIDLYCKESGISTPNALGFIQWQKAIAKPNMKLIVHLVLKYALGIYVERVGDRNNDHQLSNAGRFAFMDMFYGFPHPQYQELEYRDLQNKAIYPDQVKVQREKNLSYSSYKEPGRCQGGDFMLEQKVVF